MGAYDDLYSFSPDGPGSGIGNARLQDFVAASARRSTDDRGTSLSRQVETYGRPTAGVIRIGTNSLHNVSDA